MKNLENPTVRPKRKEELPITAEELEGMQNNDEHVWREIYERYNPDLLRIARKKVGNDYDKAEDVAQTVWLEFHSRVKTKELVADKLSHYLSIAAVRRSYTELDYQKRRPADSIEIVFAAEGIDGKTLGTIIPDRGPHTEEKVVEGMQEVELVKDLEEIMGLDRARVVYLAMEGEDHNGISSILGVTPATVRTRLMRGRKLAREPLALEKLAEGADMSLKDLEESRQKAQIKTEEWSQQHIRNK
jgi:RNA polymerase sigma factor (sigma-70 family)